MSDFRSNIKKYNSMKILLPNTSAKCILCANTRRNGNNFKHQSFGEREQEDEKWNELTQHEISKNFRVNVNN